MVVLEPVIAIEQNGSKIFERYIAEITAPIELDKVLSFLSTNLLFNHISTVIDCYKMELETAGEQRSLSPGDLLCRSRIVCLIDLQLLSDLTRSLSTFSIVAAACIDDFGNAYFNAKIRLPSVHISKPFLSFNLLGTLLSNVSHYGKSL